MKSKSKARKTAGRKAPGLRYDLIPPEPLAELAYVYTAGAEKYEARNWEQGYDQALSMRAAMSHLLKDMAGEDEDPETGAKHLAQVMFHCAAMLAWRARQTDLAVDSRSTLAQVDLIKQVDRRPLPTIKKFK